MSPICRSGFADRGVTARRVEIAHGGALKGISIPAGLTVIVGDDQSGRIDLAEAIAQGIYNHIPGDGREHV